MSTQDNSILFDVGRIVQGDLYEPQTTDMKGNPLKIISGPNAGQPRVNYFFSIAIPKRGEQAWFQTTWGAKLYQIGQQSWPMWFDPQTGQCKHPKFAWKISDGDDATPNPEANMQRNCDREGFPGCWVVRFSSGFPTKVFDESGNPLLQPGLVKRGFWVEVWGNSSSNNDNSKPGLFINHGAVAYRAPGKEIVGGPDPRAIGFGKSALPPGVTAQPIGNVANLPGAPVAPGIPMPPTAGMHAPAPMPIPPGIPGSAPLPPPAAAPAPIPVQPHAGFIAPPVPGVAPPVPPAPTMAPPVASAPPVCQLGAPPGFRMANLNASNYAGFKAQGWTDDLMLVNGHMVRL